MLAIGPRPDDQPDCLIMDEPSEGPRAHHHQGVGSDRAAEGGGPVDSAGRAERFAGTQAGGLCPRHQQGPGGLFRTPEELRANEEIKASYLGI